MAIKVFADGANLEGMLDMHDNGNVQGFTTNPSLMKAGGVTDYRAFAKAISLALASLIRLLVEVPGVEGLAALFPGFHREKSSQSWS